MSALPRGEVFSEQMWVVFFALSVKDPTLSKITEDTWLSLYGRKDSTKFDKFLKENGIEWCVKNMPLDSRFNRAGLKAAQERFPASGLNWHNALKAQVVSFRKHQKGKVAASPSFKITRQGEFYKLANLQVFLKKVKELFGAKFSDDRWNPADVWFYKDEAVRQIKDFITHSSIMDSGIVNSLPKSKQKAVAIYDVKQLNELLLVLYEKDLLLPVSLKKATGSGAVFTSRVGITNGRKDKFNQPKDPVITKKQYPIVPDGNDYVVGGTRETGGRNLKYDLKTQVATLDSKGNQVIKTEYDYVNPGTTNNIVVSSSGEFGAAQGGSMSLTEAENVIYTARGKNAVNRARRNAVPNNANIMTDVYDSDIPKAKQYMSNMARELEPGKTKGDLKLGNKTMNKNRELKYAKDAQNKLEMALAMKESGKEDELVIDLWKSCTSKGIVRRKDFERILGRAAREEKYRAKKLGKTLTNDQAEKIAFDKLSSKVSPSVKIPASVHLKLY
jgi:hypothetical protein